MHQNFDGNFDRKIKDFDDVSGHAHLNVMFDVLFRSEVDPSKIFDGKEMKLMDGAIHESRRRF